MKNIAWVVNSYLSPICKSLIVKFDNFILNCYEESFMYIEICKGISLLSIFGYIKESWIFYKWVIDTKLIATEFNHDLNNE